MAFSKTSTPQPLKIASVLCEICKKKNANLIVSGKMVCEGCSKEISDVEQEKED